MTKCLNKSESRIEDLEGNENETYCKVNSDNHAVPGTEKSNQGLGGNAQRTAKTINLGLPIHYSIFMTLKKLEKHHLVIFYLFLTSQFRNV